MRSYWLKALITIFALAGVSAGHAQQGNAQDQPDSARSAEQKQLDLSDSEVRTFARARSKVQAVRAEYQKKLKKGKDAETKREISAQMQEEMLKAVKESGMSAQKYNRISQAAMRDKELQKRIRKATK